MKAPRRHQIGQRSGIASASYRQRCRYCRMSLNVSHLYLVFLPIKYGLVPFEPLTSGRSGGLLVRTAFESKDRCGNRGKILEEECGRERRRVAFEARDMGLHRGLVHGSGMSLQSIFQQKSHVAIVVFRSSRVEYRPDFAKISVISLKYA